MAIWEGVFPALTSKFTEELTLDRSAMERHFAWQLEAGVDGFITTGSLGESSTLSMAEKAEIARIAVSVSAGRVPVLAGVAQSTTADAVELAKQAAAAGVDGLMVLPGTLYTADVREAVQHYTAVAQAVDLPLMIYNNPVAYGTDLGSEGLAALAEIENYVAIKESSDDIRRVTDLQGRFGDRYTLFAGVDNLALESLMMGAEGWVAGLVDAFPDETVAIYRLHKAGRHAEALEIYRWFAPLLKLDVSTKLVQNIKLAEAMVGRGNERVRPPRLPLAGEERVRVEAVIRQALDVRPDIPDWQAAA